MPSAEVRPGRRDLRARQRIATPVRPLRRRAASRPRSPSSTGTTPPRAGSSAPTAATSSGPGSSPWAPARCTGPSCPGIPGIETFAGPHASTPAAGTTTTPAATRTGAPMDRLADKRVGIIGTGATAVQCIPHLARGVPASSTSSSARRRRSTSATTTPIDPDVVRRRSSRAGSSEWLINFATLQTGGFADEDLVKDGWTDISQRIRDRVVAERRAGGPSSRPSSSTQAFEDSDDEKMNEIRARVDAASSRRADHGRGAQALVPPALQAAVLPRRVPAGVQRARRPPRRHRRQGRRAHRRDRRRGSAACTTSSTA